MAESAQDRNLPASARKISKARGEGQVARSRELAHFAAFAMAGSLIVGFGPQAAAALRQLLGSGLRFDAASLADEGQMLAQLGTLVWRTLPLVAGFGAAMMLAALASGLLAGGWNFTLKPLQPRLDKLDPFAGLGRIVSRQQLGETLKAVGLAIVLLTIGALYLRARLPQFAELAGLSADHALATTVALLRNGLLLLLLAVAAMALVDVPLQRQLLLGRLKMSHDEVKKEMKDVEGNVEVKAKVRARMREMASRRMLAAVPQADLVVMNPTHYAVALKYEEATMSAPHVVAKGADLLALRIRDIAAEAKVPVLQMPPLARALYAHTEVDQEIPAALFGAVAQVLAWVYQLHAVVARGGDAPPPPSVQVPPEFDPAARGRGAGRAEA